MTLSETYRYRKMTYSVVRARNGYRWAINDTQLCGVAGSLDEARSAARTQIDVLRDSLETHLDCTRYRPNDSDQPGSRAFVYDRPA